MLSFPQKGKEANLTSFAFRKAGDEKLFIGNMKARLTSSFISMTIKRSTSADYTNRDLLNSFLPKPILYAMELKRYHTQTRWTYLLVIKWATTVIQI